MRVDRLVIEDFRGIRHLELEFLDQVTVFAGINGSGKSTVLQALATLLWRVGGSLHESMRERQPAQATDVRNGATHALLFVNTDWSPPNGTAQESVDWGVRITRTLSKAQRRLESTSVRAQANYLGLVARQLKERLQQHPTASVPFAAFYRTNRAVLDIPLRIKKRHVFDQFAAFDEALDGGWSTFRLFFEWFREREDLENEKRVRSRGHVDPVLEAVRGAVAELMPGFTQLRVQRQPLSMRVMKDGEDLDFVQLSDGEKCLLAMVADIARRLALANPGVKDPRTAAAVVLIDEIELHLHPRWQREVVPGLRRAFPNCQFLVSTHSPQVLASVKPQDVYVLAKGEHGIVATRPSVSFGRESNEILLEVMDTPARPAEIRARLDAMFARIDVGDLAGAKAIRAQLEMDIGADEPEFVRADMLLRLRGSGR
ncbi:MAG: AAA family ATPase [Planctomycetes bacterium]|jgi:predicted ATP-binding protein involved in virulence|nr:AAA family ATPase [Planctomycetota bacterium]